MSGSSRYEIDIIANNKAAAALGKTDKQLKKIQASSKTVNKSFNTMKIAAGAAAAAFAGFKIGQVFLDTAKQVENLGIQLKFITGSAELGAQALKTVEEAAGRSAFSLENMANAAPLLLTVGTIDQLADSLDMTGDIAAATGLSFEEVAGQLQRAMSGGIAAADMFREKGVKSLLGFQEGVQYTAEQTEKMIRDAFANGTTTVVGAAAEMAKTWDGQMSMMGDAWFKFKKRTMDSGLFEALKDQLTGVQSFIDANSVAINAMAEAIGQALATGVQRLGQAVAFAVTHAGFFLTVAKGLVALKLATYITKIIPAFKALNLVMRANPIGAVITAIVALVGYLSFKNGLGRTIVQIEAAFDVLGKAMSAFGSFLYDKLGVAVKWMRDRFYDFVDGIIDAYNWIAKLIPGMSTFDKEASELGDTLGNKLAGGMEYLGTKAGEMGDAILDALPEEVSTLVNDVANAVAEAGIAFDIAEEKANNLAVQNDLLAQATAHIDPVMTLAAEKTKLLNEETVKLTETSKAGATAAEEWATEWARLYENLFPVASEIAEINATIDTLNQKIAEGGPNTDLYAQAIVRLKQQLAELDPATQQLIESMQGYEDSIMRIARLEDEASERKVELTELMRDEFEALNPLARATREYTDDLAKLDEALAAGVISQQRHIEMTEQYGERFSKFKDGMKEDVAEMKDASGDFVKDFNEKFNDKLADGLVEGNLNFKSFADLFKSTLKDLISDALNGGSMLKDIFSMLGGLFGGSSGGGLTSLFDTKGVVDNFSQFAGDAVGGHMARNLPFFADGGRLGAGKLGIAGEAGPEIITGPANIMSNEDSFGNSGDKPQVNITIQAIDTQTGTEFLLKNRKQVEGIIQSAYNKRGKQGIY